MLTYWETLAAIQSNVPVNDSYAQLCGRKSRGGYTVTTYTGTLPATLTGTKAGYLHRYKIYGNTEQIGTPTPENPIMPSECGELETTGAHAGQYKLPLTSAGQDVNIYLGESETTRRIKKLVLTGEESWNTQQKTYYIRINNYYRMYDVGSHLSACSHYPNSQQYGPPGKCYGLGGLVDGQTSTRWNGNIVFNPSPTISSRTDWISYLAAQYAAGTPVTVWYVLNNPETGTLNEPLRKIGDYADTIDSTQTNVQIPTSAGSTTISWAGQGLAPSKVELEYEKKR